MRSKVLSASIFLALSAAMASPLRADTRIIPPQIATVRPVGMERGTTETFTLDGRNLSDIKGVIFDVPGITAKVTQIADIPEMEFKVRIGVDTSAPVPRGKKQTATLEITAARDVTPGMHWFRVRTPLGTTNLMAFEVGAFPEVKAGEPAGMNAEAQPKTSDLPATFVGTIDVPGQEDNYRFEGRAGEELVFKVTAAPLGSMLESQLVLKNEAGDVLAQSGEYLDRPDAVLTYKLPQAGKYTLTVTDREKAGSADRFYRVDAGPLPYISHVFPLGVQAGESSMVEVEGVNLGTIHEVKVDDPKSVSGWTTLPLQVHGDGGPSINTVKLVVGNAPEIREQEPNSSPEQAQAISLPVTINGHISGGADKLRRAG